MAVHEEIGHHGRWAWTEPFVHFAAVVARGGPTAYLGRSQRALWVEALIISHGRIIEAGLVTCMPDGDFGSWGSPFRHCEGVRLAYAGGYFTDVEFLRVAQQGEGFDPTHAP